MTDNNIPLPALDQVFKELLSRESEDTKFDKRKQTIPAEEVWLRVFCAVSGAMNTNYDLCIKWADYAVVEFSKRFKNYEAEE